MGAARGLAKMRRSEKTEEKGEKMSPHLGSPKSVSTHLGSPKSLSSVNEKQLLKSGSTTSNSMLSPTTSMRSNALTYSKSASLLTRSFLSSSSVSHVDIAAIDEVK